MEEGAITEWLKSLGEKVNRGDVLYNTQTDKSVVEVDSPFDGILVRYVVQPNVTVPVGTVIGVMASEGEAISEAAIDEFLLSFGTSGASGDAMPAELQAPVASTPVTSAKRSVTVSPRARQLAGTLGVDVATVTSTGPNGIISEDDIRRAARLSEQPGQTDVPFSPIELTMARRLEEAWRTIPHFVQMITVDVTELLSVKKHLATMAGGRIPPSLTAVLAKLTAAALTRHPRINSQYHGDRLTLFADVHMSVAVDTPRGLVVPVLRSVNRADIWSITEDLKALADKARESRLKPSDFEGGTFTLSNLGAYGVESGTPVINPPQIALLFVGAIVPRPWAVGASVAVRPTMSISVAFDHRSVDGAAASRFTSELRDLLSNPSTVLTGP